MGFTLPPAAFEPQLTMPAVTSTPPGDPVMLQTDSLTSAAAEVLTAARSLPADQQVALADRLLEGAEAAGEERPPFSATEAEMGELRKLADDVRAGREPMFDADEVLAELGLEAPAEVGASTSGVVP